MAALIAQKAIIRRWKSEKVRHRFSVESESVGDVLPPGVSVGPSISFIIIQAHRDKFYPTTLRSLSGCYDQDHDQRVD